MKKKTNTYMPQRGIILLHQYQAKYRLLPPKMNTWIILGTLRILDKKIQCLVKILKDIEIKWFLTRIQMTLQSLLCLNFTSVLFVKLISPKISFKITSESAFLIKKWNNKNIRYKMKVLIKLFIRHKM